MKIYKVSETEWYKANSLEEAITCAMADTGLSREELTDGMTPAELTADEMNTMEYITEDREDTMPFRVRLASELAEGYTAPGFFARKN